MVELRDIIVTGKAPNDDLNVTTEYAITIKNYFEQMFDGTHSRVLGLFINTTNPSTSGAAQLVNIKDVVPHPEGDMEFYYQLSVESPTLPQQYWEVSSISRAITNGNLELMTRDYMSKIDPAWNYLTFKRTYEGTLDVLTQIFTESIPDE